MRAVKKVYLRAIPCVRVAHCSDLLHHRPDFVVCHVEGRVAYAVACGYVGVGSQSFLPYMSVRSIMVWCVHVCFSDATDAMDGYTHLHHSAPCLPPSLPACVCGVVFMRQIHRLPPMPSIPLHVIPSAHVCVCGLACGPIHPSILSHTHTRVPTFSKRASLAPSPLLSSPRLYLVLYTSYATPRHARDAIILGTMAFSLSPAHHTHRFVGVIHSPMPCVSVTTTLLAR